MKTAKPVPQARVRDLRRSSLKEGVASGGRGSWLHAFATSLPVLLAQGLIYIYVIKGLGAERVAAAVIGLMLLAPVLIALAHAASQQPSRRPGKANQFLLPKPLRLG